jgi:hypothetical protein
LGVCVGGWGGGVAGRIQIQWHSPVTFPVTLSHWHVGPMSSIDTWAPHVSDSMSRRMSPVNVTESESGLAPLPLPLIAAIWCLWCFAHPRTEPFHQTFNETSCAGDWINLDDCLPSEHTF